MCPPNRPKNAFYLQPLQNPTPTCWFTCKPVGHNKLEGTVARLCKLAGIPGYRTNHSLRATAATRLYQAGIDEQLVIEMTGHRSLDGVRGYKHTSMPQKEALSDILNSQTEASNSLVPAVPSTSVSLPPTQVVDTTHTAQSLAMNFTSPPTLNFHSCSVTINFNGKH